MQIKNNGNEGSRPNQPKQNPVEKRAEAPKSAEVEKKADSATQRSSKEVRQARDSFQRSKPQQDPGVDVGERLRQARAQANQDRIGDARSKDSRDSREQRIKSARVKDSRERREARLENARNQHTESAKANRIANARKQASHPVDGNKSRDSVQTRSNPISMEGTVEDARGLRETSEVRAERLRMIKLEHENGLLNTVDRARAAAERLLDDA